MALDHDTIAHLPVDLSDLENTRNVLLLLIQQIDKIIGNRPTTIENTYVKVEPSVGYIQTEIVQIADDLKNLFDRVENIEAKLTPVNGNA